MAEDEDKRNRFMQRLMETHKWRFTLRVGQAVDARLTKASQGSATAAATSTSTPTTATAAAAVARGGDHATGWQEARVVTVDEESVELHFLGFSDSFNVKIDRLSRDIRPLQTFTTPWRHRLKRGSVVEIRGTPEDLSKNDADGDGGGGGGCWKRGVVLKVSLQVASADADDGGDGEDGETRYEAQHLEEHSFDYSRRVMAALVMVESGSAKGNKRWVDVNGEDICEEGTHLSGRLSDGSCEEAESPVVSPQPSTSTPPPPSALRSSPASVGETTPRGCDAGNATNFERRVALVGSSGGGAAAQGQSDGLSLLRLAKKELQMAGVDVAAVQFVACAEPLDAASPASAATLWVAGSDDGDQGLVVAAEGTLSKVNAAAGKEDARIAAALRVGCGSRRHDARDTATSGSIDAPAAQAARATGDLPPLHGVVAISCDVGGVNRQTLIAARDCRAPIVGTGGSSLGAVMAMGCLLVGSSGGSVATTNKSKVVSYAAGLAGHWRLGYDSAKELMQPLAPAATFAGCLPAQIGVMVAVALGSSATAGSSSSLSAAPWVGRLSGAVPVVAAAVAARQVSTLGEMATAAGILAGSMCMEDTLAALAAGTLAGYLCSKMTGFALDSGVPATALSLYATATSGILSGAIVLSFLPFLKMLGAIVVSTNSLLLGVRSSWIQAIIGAGMGCLMCYGSKVGWYHRFFLPVIVLELAAGVGSIWGSIDLCALCMVAAGLCAARVVQPRIETDLPLAKRGLAFNLCFGDFVEAAYPFMDRCGRCNAGAYLGSALSGAVVAVSGATSTAYLPLPLAIVACSQPCWLLGAASAAFLPAFALGLVSRPRTKEK